MKIKAFLVPAAITTVFSKTSIGKAQLDATTTDSSSSSTKISESAAQVSSKSATENW